METKVTQTLFEKSIPGKTGFSLPKLDVPKSTDLEKKYRRTGPIGLPELSEIDVVRHFTELSHKNFSIDRHFYPLGSCTMKYNPKINEAMANLPEFAMLHPFQNEDHVQGILEILYLVQNYLSELTGLAAVTLQPSAGAQGEYVGVRIVRDYFKKRGEDRKYIIIPDSAHGTNPASAAFSGFKVLTVKSNKEGRTSVPDLQKTLEKYGKEIACIMMTNPNTLGLFENDVVEIAGMMHQNGSLLYYDGANLNAIIGKVRPGDMGFDIIHLNLHKTFSTPHGGGGPGSGPVCVSDRVKEFLPNPYVTQTEDRYSWSYNHTDSIGPVRSFYGNVLVILRAFAYILAMGKTYLPKIAEYSVLNANYLKEKLKTIFPVYIDQPCMHEFVLHTSTKFFREKNIHTMDIAKRLIDYGIHPPTVYFPINVSEAIMIEPTETESKATLDEFVSVLHKIFNEINEDPDIVKNAPHIRPGGRMDEAKAVKQPQLVEK